MTFTKELLTRGIDNAVSNLGLTDADTGVSLTINTLNQSGALQAAEQLAQKGFELGAQAIGIS